MEKVFEGLKVIELASVLAGPAVGMFFAELGAEVIKIESLPAGGDATRQWKLPEEDPESKVSAYFSSINYKKSYLFLDLKKEDHINTVYRLVKDADVLISNFKQGDDLKFGVDPSRIRLINPKIIYAHLRGFDSEPARAAYDVVLQAEAGFMAMNGTPQSGPLKMPLAFVDILAAHQLKEAILIALIQRSKDGKGKRVDCSLEAAAISTLTNMSSNYLMAGHIHRGTGSLHPNIAPYGDTFYCKDGDAVVLAVGTDKQFRKLCGILGDESIADNPLFANNKLRVSNRAALDEALSVLFSRHSRTELMKSLISSGVPAGAVRSMDQVFDNSTARAMVREEEIDGVLTKRVSSIAFDLSDL